MQGESQSSCVTWSPFTPPTRSLSNTYVSTGSQERGKSGEPNLKTEGGKKRQNLEFQLKAGLLNGLTAVIIFYSALIGLS